MKTKYRTTGKGDMPTIYYEVADVKKGVPSESWMELPTSILTTNLKVTLIYNHGSQSTQTRLQKRHSFRSNYENTTSLNKVGLIKNLGLVKSEVSTSHWPHTGPVDCRLHMGPVSVNQEAVHLFIANNEASPRSPTTEPYNHQIVTSLLITVTSIRVGKKVVNRKLH